MKTRRARLDHLLEFQNRGQSSDGYGNHRDTFITQFSEPAGLIYRRGGETETAARLQARQPVVITVNRNARTETIRPHWRAVAGDRWFNIVERPTLSEDGRFLEMLAEAVQADG